MLNSFQATEYHWYIDCSLFELKIMHNMQTYWDESFVMKINWDENTIYTARSVRLLMCIQYTIFYVDENESVVAWK